MQLNEIISITSYSFGKCPLLTGMEGIFIFAALCSFFILLAPPLREKYSRKALVNSVVSGGLGPTLAIFNLLFTVVRWAYMDASSGVSASLRDVPFWECIGLLFPIAVGFGALAVAILNVAIILSRRLPPDLAVDASRRI